MRDIESFPPPEDLPVRRAQPRFMPETCHKLIKWALMQPGGLPWLLKRSFLYWQRYPGVGDAHNLRLEAITALDLLRWRLEIEDDRAAVEHLNDFAAVEANPQTGQVALPATCGANGGDSYED